MKILMLGAFFCWLTLAPLSAQTPDGPHLQLENPTYHFGDVPRKGGDLTHEFRFVNNGSKPLVIQRVITSCSCLKASFSKRPIAPADSGVIRIIYQPLKSEPGTFNKVIQVYSNSIDGRDVITVQGHSIEGKMRKQQPTD